MVMVERKLIEKYIKVNNDSNIFLHDTLNKELIQKNFYLMTQR